MENHSMRIFALLAIAFAVLTAIFIQLVAPSFSGEGQLIFENTSDIEVNFETIQEAARPLLNQGLTIAIYIVPTGSHEALQAQLAAANLLYTDRVRTDALVIYLGMENEYSEIGWGENNTSINIDQIRHRVMNPELQEARFSSAIINTIQTVEERLDNPYAFIMPSLKFYIAGFPGNTPIGSIIVVVVLSIATVARILNPNGGTGDGRYYNSSSSSSSGSSGSSGGSWNN